MEIFRYNFGTKISSDDQMDSKKQTLMQYPFFVTKAKNEFILSNKRVEMIIKNAHDRIR